MDGNGPSHDHKGDLEYKLITMEYVVITFYVSAAVGENDCDSSTSAILHPAHLHPYFVVASLELHHR